MRASGKSARIALTAPMSAAASAVVKRRRETGSLPNGAHHAHIAPEGWLVHRREAQRSVVGLAGDVARGGLGIIGEAGGEGLAERVEVVGVAVVTQVPDRQHFVAALGVDERVDRGEVVRAIAAVDQRPGDTFACDSDA
jgi:hypothetical protein